MFLRKVTGARSFKKSLFTLIIAAGCGVAISCFTSTTSSTPQDKSFWTEGSGEAPPNVITPELYVDIGKKVNEAVVNISTVENVKPQRQGQGRRQAPPFGFGGPGQGQGGGQSPFDDFFNDFFFQNLKLKIHEVNLLLQV